MNKECKLCDRVWGVAGIAMGMLIMLIGFDLLSGGFLASKVGSPVTEESEDAETIESDE
jgi:hypothetical protein